MGSVISILHNGMQQRAVIGSSRDDQRSALSLEKASRAQGEVLLKDAPKAGCGCKEVSLVLRYFSPARTQCGSDARVCGFFNIASIFDQEQR